MYAVGDRRTATERQRYACLQEELLKLWDIVNETSLTTLERRAIDRRVRRLHRLQHQLDQRMDLRAARREQQRAQRARQLN